MTEFVTTIDDVLASTQVLEDVMNRADSFTAEEAIEFRVAVEKVQAAAKLTIDLINQELLRSLDGQPGIERDGVLYFVGAKTVKTVTDHDAVGFAVEGVVHEVLHEMDDEGEGVNAEQVVAAARAAVKVMRDLYISPSTSVKVQQLDKYGISRSVVDKQRGEKVVKTAPVNRIEP